MNQLQIIGILGGCLLAAGAGVLLAVVCFRGRLASRRPGREEISDGLAARADIRSLMGQLERLADGIDQRMSSRLDELKRLLAEADATIAELRSGLQRPKESDPSASPHIAAQPGHSPQGAQQPAERLSPRDGEVVRLASRGLDTIEIARRMNMNIGEVELILNLHPASHDAK